MMAMAGVCCVGTAAIAPCVSTVMQTIWPQAHRSMVARFCGVSVLSRAVFALILPT